MKTFVFLIIGFLHFAAMAGVPQIHLLNSANEDADTQLFKFVVGKWQLNGGACVSGQPVNWGDDFKSFTLHAEFKPDLTFEMNLIKSGVLITKISGSFGLNDRTLFMRTIESCSYGNNMSSCNVQNPPQVSSALMSIQGQELWLLSNQGTDGGSCPAQDIFIMKFLRE